MKRFCLANIIGDGSDEGGDFRAATADYPLDTMGAMPWDDAKNQPKNKWMLVEVTRGDLSACAGDTRIDVLPDCPLEALVSTIEPAEREAMRLALVRRNISVSMPSNETFGAVLAAVSRRAEEGTVVPAIAQLIL